MPSHMSKTMNVMLPPAWRMTSDDEDDEDDDDDEDDEDDDDDDDDEDDDDEDDDDDDGQMNQDDLRYQGALSLRSRTACVL